LIHGRAHYWKEGEWKNDTVDFVIYRNQDSFWLLGIRGKDLVESRSNYRGCGRSRANNISGLYRSVNTSDTELPPMTSWMVTGDVTGSSPKLSWEQE
jgi:hypothetical protein